MDHSNVTITLPLTGHGLGVILTALGIGVGTGIVWLILSEQDRAPRKKPASLLTAFAVIMAPVWLVIFAGTLWQVWLMLSGAPSASGTGPSLGMGALLAALLGAPFLVWGTVLKQQTVDFQKEGHITDRITAAVEQLGAEKTVKKIVDGETQETSEPNIEVRIGAILSLERIAQDSTRYDKGRDHVRVMEILCAYVRENSHATVPEDYPEPDWEPLPEDADADSRLAQDKLRDERFGDDVTNSKAREWAASLPKPRADIAQVLKVLGRRTTQQRLVEAQWPEPPGNGTVWPFDIHCPEPPEIDYNTSLTAAQIETFKKELMDWRATLRAYSGYRLDLRDANLQRADLSAKRPDASDAVFSGALLERARMEGSSLDRSRIEGANVNAARLEGADLIGTKIEGADVCDARMEGANLSAARMSGVYLLAVRLEGATMHNTILTGADLSFSCMERVDISFARLEGAKLDLVLLDGARLFMARMEAIELSHTLLRDAELIKTNFSTGSMRNMDLSEVPISVEQMNSTFGDASVILPDDIPRPAHWPDWELPVIGADGFKAEWRNWQADPEGYTPPPKPGD